MANKTLSKSSPFEQAFKTRYRGPGRPPGEEVFETADVHPLIKRQAQRRAFAVVHGENRDRLNEVYRAELAVLKRRGVEAVAEDCGVEL